MSRARSLTLGPARPKAGTQQGGMDYACLRRLTAAERPALDTFLAVLRRTLLAPQSDEQRDVWGKAQQRYTDLTGEGLGSILGEEDAPCCYGYVTSLGQDHEPGCPR